MACRHHPIPKVSREGGHRVPLHHPSCFWGWYPQQQVSIKQSSWPIGRICWWNKCIVGHHWQSEDTVQPGAFVLKPFGISWWISVSADFLSMGSTKIICMAPVWNPFTKFWLKTRSVLWMFNQRFVTAQGQYVKFTWWLYSASHFQLYHSISPPRLGAENSTYSGV